MVGLPTSSYRHTRWFQFGAQASPALSGGLAWIPSTYSFFIGLLFFVTLSFCLPSLGWTAPGHDKAVRHIRTAIPILGTTMNEQAEPMGIVAEIELEFLQRPDHEGLDVQFQTTPGKFSPYAQQSVIKAIYRVVEEAQLNPDSWTVRFQLPYPGVTLYGESLSAMAALTIISLAKNEPVDEDTVLTGTVTADGQVGTVGGVPLKILAAHEKHFRKVLIPEEPDVADGDWVTPFLMEVRPVGTISKAYLALTNRPLRTILKTHSLTAGLTP